MSHPMAVQLSGIRKTFEGVVAVDALDLSIPRGSTYGVLGPNGAGKTTIIRMILRIIDADHGTIEIFGARLAPAALDRIGYLPEERGIYKNMKLRRLLSFFAELKGMSPRQSRPRIMEWLERFDLTDRADAKVKELSKGNQQKVQFISAILHDPDIMILDEPFSGLDPINSQALKDTVVELKHRGKTVIFSTHLMDNAERLCDSVCIIARGEKVLDGNVNQVKEEHGQRNIALSLEGDGARGVSSILRDASLVRRADDSNRFFEIEMAPGADPQALLRRIVESGIAVQRFEMIQPSLHQIFLQKVGAETREPGAPPWAPGVEEGMSGNG
jgi:ABC-2 type transport system ATP-binding protein